MVCILVVCVVCILVRNTGGLGSGQVHDVISTEVGQGAMGVHDMDDILH